MSIAPDHRYAPIALWRVASGLMTTLFNLFGAPQDLARKHTIVARDYKLISNWLRSVEALFRKLLLIEASYYATDVGRPGTKHKRERNRREMTFTPENPEAWRASFRAMERHVAPASGRRSARLRRACGAERRAPNVMHLAPTTFHSAWPLAERFEALLRVHNNPAPYAKRLARRLYAEPARVAGIGKEPPELQHRIDPEPHAALAILVAKRTPAFCNSS